MPQNSRSDFLYPCTHQISALEFSCPAGDSFHTDTTPTALFLVTLDFVSRGSAPCGASESDKPSSNPPFPSTDCTKVSLQGGAILLSVQGHNLEALGLPGSVAVLTLGGAPEQHLGLGDPQTSAGWGLYPLGPPCNDAGADLMLSQP